MSNLVYWSIAVIVLFIGVYLTYENGRQLLRARQAKQEFIARHRDSSLQVAGQFRFYLFACLALLCLLCFFAYVFAIFDDQGSRTAQSLIYAGLFLFCLAMAMESYTLSRVALCPEGFMVMSEYVRFKNVRDIVEPSGFLKSPELILQGGQSLQLPKSDLALILPLWKSYREARTQKRSRKKRHG